MNGLILKLTAGFTLFELIVVLMMLAIISLLAVPRWTGSTFGLEFEARRVLNDVRYAQALSMTTGQRYRWVKLSATSYQIQNEAGSAIPLPGGATTLTSGATLGSMTNLTNNLVSFDSQGAPYNTSTYPGTPLSAAAVVSILGSSQTHTVQITPFTGYAVLQ